MTDNIEWGPPIEVMDRPEWLGDYAIVRPRWGDVVFEEYGAPACCVSWPVTSFQLRADYPAYLAISKGFTPWAGGDKAPEDWDGGEVLSTEGKVFYGGGTWDWRSNGRRDDIIGYRRRTQAQELNHLQKEGQAFELCEETVRACLAALGDSPSFSSIDRGMWDYCYDCVQALLPKPDVAKLLVERYRQTFPNCDIVATHMDDEIAFAKWAVSEGLINIEKVGE